jgi:MFS family permease
MREGQNTFLELSLLCGNAILMSVIPPYITETAPKKYSGLLSSMYALSLGFGLIYSVLAGRFITWTLLSFIASIPSLLLGVLAPFLVYPQEDDMMARLTRTIQCESQDGSRVTVRNPGTLFIFLASVFIASGICPLSIFEEYLFMDQRTFKVGDLTLASNISQVIGGIIGAVLIDKFGRKPDLRAGTWVCLLSNVLLSLYFSTTKDSHQCPTSPGSFLCWSPAVATCLFFLGFGGGIGNIFFVLLGELIPPSKAGKLVPLITFYLNLLQFIVLRTFISVEFILGLTNIFFIQTGVNIFLLFGIGTWIPETKPEKVESQNRPTHYGTINPTFDVNRYTTASGSGLDDQECVLDNTSFFSSFRTTLHDIPEDEQSN